MGFLRVCIFGSCLDFPMVFLGFMYVYVFFSWDLARDLLGFQGFPMDFLGFSWDFLCFFLHPWISVPKRSELNGSTTCWVGRLAKRSSQRIKQTL